VSCWGKRNDVAWLPVFSALPGFGGKGGILSGPASLQNPAYQCSMLHRHNLNVPRQEHQAKNSPYGSGEQARVRDREPSTLRIQRIMHYTVD
jgi:hypothetical protein